jgi:hypothetical protein
LVPVYAKVLNQIKEWAPKLDTLSYKEWTPEVKARVENWIKVVESGGNPATETAPAAEIINEVNDTPKAEPMSMAEAVANSSVDVNSGDDNDELPF